MSGQLPEEGYRWSADNRWRGYIAGHYANGLTTHQLQDPNMRADGFSGTSHDLVQRKVDLFGLKDVTLIRLLPRLTN
jgi:hypothetical protein